LHPHLHFVVILASSGRHGYVSIRQAQQGMIAERISPITPYLKNIFPNVAGGKNQGPNSNR
jgi:hypothetical protein